MIEVLKIAILELMRRKNNLSFSPDEVLKQLYPEDWQLFLPEIYSTLLEMHKIGLVELDYDGDYKNLSESTANHLKIRKPTKLI